MAAYKDLVGQKITVVTSNPPEPKTGQMWYNSTDGVLRSLGITEAFSSAASMGTSRYGHGAAGNKGGGIVASGRPPASGPAAMVTAEEYNGSGFSATNNINTGRFFAGNSFGTQTAAVFAGGYSPSAPNQVKTELYDGSSFSESGDMSESKYASCNAGTTTAGLIAGGSPARTSTEEFGGSSWTSGNVTNSNFQDRSGLGTQTAAISMGGAGPPGSPFAATETEFYDGTTWTVGASMNTGRRRASGGGSQTLGLVYGGLIPGPAATNKSELYDGASWSNSANMGTSRYYGNGNSSGGTFAVGDVYVAGGLTSPGAPNHTTAAEEFNRSTNTITAAAWAAGGTVPYASRQNMSFGTQTAAIACGGHPPGNLNTSVSYDGTSYSSTPNLNSATRIGGVAGTQAAGYEYGGIQPPGVYNANTQTWNGSSWSNSPYNLNNGTYGMMSCGTSTAALSAGGEDPGGSPWNVTEEYDGEGWTSGNTMPVSRYYGAGDGTQTSAFIAAGSAPVNTTTLEYDGTNWATGGSLLTNTGAGGAASGENSDSGLVFGGTPAVAVTQGYDGTSWSTRPSLGTGRGFTTGNGTATAALIVSGGPPSGTSTATEEFTGETTALNVKTLTQS
jgi:hypothetical protein